MINKYLVNVFKLLQQYDKETDKFTKLSNIYGVIKFNDKLLLKFYNDYEENKNNIQKLTYFKNTNIEEVLKILNNEELNILKSNLNDAYIFSKKKLFSVSENTCCSDKCGKNCNNVKDMMKNKKVQKMLNKKGMKQLLQSQLGKQLNQKNGNLEEMLKNTLKDQLPGNQFDMLKNLMNNPMLKTIFDKLFTEENIEKIQTIFHDILNDNDILDEINKFKHILNETKITSIITNIFKDLSDFKGIEDIVKIQDILENNKDLKEIYTKIETSINSGLVDQDKLLKIFEKVTEKLKKSIMEMNILDKNNITIIKNLFNSFNSNPKEKTVSKEKRREKRIKKNRRNIRSQLKNKKKNKKNKKRN